MSPLTNLQQRDIETLIHPYTNLDAFRHSGPTILERGQGIYVWDTEGKRYIEGLAGLWCTSLGYGQKELIETAKEQLEKLSFSHLFGGKSHDPAIELAEKLKEIVPHQASKVLFTCSGSEANDTQIKLAWYYNNARGLPEKKKIISRHRGYHGVTVATASLTGLPANHADFDLPIDRILHTGCPHHYRCAEPGESEEDFATRLAAELETLLEQEGPDTVAAFIAEPVMGAGGVIVPPETYFEKIQAVLAPHDILFIVDEVICGFGRTGAYFGSETFGIEPDSVSVAKAITSAYAPLGAVTVSEDVYQAMLDESRKIGIFGHGFTYTRTSPLHGHRAQDARDLRARRHCRPCPIGGPDFPNPTQRSRQSPIGRRSARHWSDRRARARCRQSPQNALRARARCGTESHGLLPRRRRHFARPGRHAGHLPAAGHRPGRGRCTVRRG